MLRSQYLQQWNQIMAISKIFKEIAHALPALQIKSGFSKIWDMHGHKSYSKHEFVGTSQLSFAN